MSGYGQRLRDGARSQKLRHPVGVGDQDGMLGGANGHHPSGLDDVRAGRAEIIDIEGRQDRRAACDCGIEPGL